MKDSIGIFEEIESMAFTGCPKLTDLKISGKLKKMADGGVTPAELARALYEEYSSDRGALAKILLASPLSAVGFSALEDPRPGRELLKKRPFSHLCRLIPPYASPYGISPAGKERSES